MSIDKFRLHDILQTLVVISNASEALKHRLYESLEKLCEGSEQVGPVKITEKEMSAKELVEKMEAIIESGEYVPWGSPDHVVARFKKEAGL